MRYREDGAIEFLGRSDDQVKINGFRIHLSEVENALQRLPGCDRQSFLRCLTRFGARQLTGFLVADSDLEDAAWRKATAERLPPYMVPSRITLVSTLPLTPNGKVDRRALAQLATAPPGHRLTRRRPHDTTPRPAPAVSGLRPKSSRCGKKCWAASISARTITSSIWGGTPCWPRASSRA